MSISNDPSEEVVRMMLSGAEVTVRLTASAAKNLLAISIALAKSHKQLCGRTNMKKMLKETRDLRAFHMSREEFQRFQKEAKSYKLLYSYVRDDRQSSVDVILPATELGRANLLFEKILYGQEHSQSHSQSEPAKTQETDSKNVSRSKPDWSDTRRSETSRTSAEPNRKTRTTSEKPSVLEKLEGYRQKIREGQTSAKTRNKERANTKHER